MVDIAALTTSTNGGFIPQARHGGSGVRAFAVVGSKLDGTGFEKEHIGQTQVAATDGGAGGTGLARRSGAVARLEAARGGPRDARLEGFAYRVILGDDLRKPTCRSSARCINARWDIPSLRRTLDARHP